MKILSSIILIFILTLSPLLEVFAYDIIDDKKIAVKNILLTKSDLKKIKNGDKYVIAMDDYVNNIKDSEEKLDNIKNKINTVIDNIEYKQWQGDVISRNETQLLSILKYLDARIYFMQLDILQKKEDAAEEKIQNILDTINNTNISVSDKKRVDDTIIKIQKNLLEKSKQNTYNLLGDFEEYFNYENNGDFEMNLNIDHESIGDIEAELKISDYITQVSNFDSRFEGHISAMINALPKGENEVKAEFNSFIDFISKDGQLYTLVKDLEIVTDENIEIMQDTLDSLKTLAQENNYIEISDEESVAAMKFIQSFHPDNFFNDAESLLSQAMFTAYEKKGETYSIIPTKYACDTIKVFMNKFDPFSPNSCTESQYKDLIKDIVSKGEITLTLGNKNILKYSQSPDEQIDIFDISTTFTDLSIEKINLNIVPNQNKYSDENLTLNYEKNNSLNFQVYGDSGNMNITFESTLDSRNNFSNFNSSGYIQGWNDIQEWDISLKNKLISGKYILQTKQREYNYDTGEYEEKNPSIFAVHLSGNNNYKNELENISITFNGNDSERDYLNGEMIYNLPHLKFASQYSDKYGNAEFNFNGQWNTQNNNFDSFQTFAEINQIPRSYNYNTYEYEITGDEEKVFDMNYSLNNTVVNGVINAYDDNEIIFGIVTDGTYKKNQLELKNEITADFINMYFSQGEKARDSSRISDIKLLESAIEQSYQDYAEYPTQENFTERVLEYLWEIPRDPKENIEINGCKFGYKYEVGNDDNGIENGSYNISTCFESKNNLVKAENDNGSDTLRYEIGAFINQKMSESFYINNYTSWEKQDSQEESIPVIHFNFGYDNTLNNSNQNIYIDTIFEDKKILEFNMKNTGTIEYKKIDIEKPENSVPLEEVFENNSYYY